jgi:hypothetical protein
MRRGCRVGLRNHIVKRAASREVVYLRDDEVGFLNVDVDVFSRTPLDALTAALGKQILINYVGREGRRYSAHFSLYHPRSADAAIRRLARVIMKLPTRARRLWDQASKRVFNVGFQSGLRPHSLESEISSAAVEAAAGIRASIAVTIYAVQGASPKGATRRSQRR